MSLKHADQGKRIDVFSYPKITDLLSSANHIMPTVVDPLLTLRSAATPKMTETADASFRENFIIFSPHSDK